MHVRHTIQPTRPLNLIDIRFDQDIQIFTVSTPNGFAIYRTWPLALLRKRDVSNGALAIIQPIHTSSLLLLVGGRRSPLYPPNKVVVWDDALGHEVAELEFRERVLGLASRREWIAVALKRRVVVFKIDDGVITRYGEYETSVNERGLLALSTAPNSTLLAIPGRQQGHAQLIHLPPCPEAPPLPVQPPPTPYDPPAPIPAPRAPPPTPYQHGRQPVSIITAHSTPLTTLSVPPSGRLLATTSERGTLVRIWDTHTGKLVRELRRGTDKAEIYGVAFRGDEREVCVWSDKGTIHVFKIGIDNGESGDSSRGNRQSALQQYSPFKLPKYFDSEWSYASYRLPAPTAHISLKSALRGGGERGEPTTMKHQPLPGEGGGSVDDTEDVPEKCVVGWIEVPVRVPVAPGTGRKSPSPQVASREKGKSRASFSLPTPPSPKGTSRSPPSLGRDDLAGDQQDYREEMQYQLVALTYSGCWYRLSVPSSSSSLGTSAPSSPTSAPAVPVSTAYPAQLPPPGTRRTSSSTSTATAIPIPTSRQARGGSSVSGSPTSGQPTSPPKTGSSPLRTGALSSTPPRSSPLSTHTHMQPHRAPPPSSMASTSAASTARAPTSTPASRKGKEKESSSSSRAGVSRKDSKSSGATEKVSRTCNLEEFRRFGRWDGWI